MLNIEAYVLLELILVGAGQGHRAGAVETQNHRAPTQAQNQSKIPLGIWFSIQSPWLPPRIFPFYPLGCLQWIRHLEPVAPGGRGRS